MEIKILGARGNIKPEAPGYKQYSGVLVDNAILLDLGEPEYLDFGPQCIFITHLHSDHAVFMEEVLEVEPPIYAPEEHHRTKLIEDTIEHGGYLVTPVPTLHSKHVKACSYIVEKDKKRLFYTGDVAEYPEGSLNDIGKFDAVISEASYINRGGRTWQDKETGKSRGHLGIPDFIEAFKPHTNRMIFMHFGSWFVRDPAKGKQQFEKLTGNFPDMDLEIAHDGVSYSL